MTERATPSPIARLLSTIKEWACALAFPAALIGGALFVITMHASCAPL